MKKWKREMVECGLILIFAMLAWWWVSGEYEKSCKVEKVVKIYQGIWRKGGYLEVQK